MEHNLLKNIVKNTKTGCWIWTGQISNTGYGRLMIRNPEGGNRQESAHTASYLAFVGPLPEGALVRQACGNRLCVNPAHLETFRPVGKEAWVTAPVDD